MDVGISNQVYGEEGKWILEARCNHEFIPGDEHCSLMHA